jgi:Type II secretory pathway, pullulanase PulA and related glycosidases
MGSLSIHLTTPLPLGAQKLSSDRYRFSLVAPRAQQVILVLLDPFSEIHEIPLSSTDHRTGAIWHIEISGISNEWSYAYKLRQSDSAFPNFSTNAYIADPYSKNIFSPQLFGSSKQPNDYTFSYLKQEDFDWEGDTPLRLPKENYFIYEMHVRSFTQDPSSQVTHPGTFLGIIEKIDHLKKLGVNAVELLPIFEFDETIHPFKNKDFPHLCNYWGYSSINFFCPSRRYTYGTDPCAPAREFKTLVKTLHRAGIEVILDVVFNHTGFEGTSCPLPWIDLESYYMVNDNGDLLNFSGCGNTVNTNTPIAIKWILDALRYWVQEMHVDGFRFDLAAVFSRDLQGVPRSLTPILQAISSDSILSETKLIAEPWDAGGLYQLGHFPSISTRWSEWNGCYRDHVKAFLNGDPHQVSSFASRISGSRDIYPAGNSTNSINYICSHDGFTLYDSVAYNHKHNEENGENNRDGTSANYSYNFGCEGETTDPNICQLRERQMKNFFLALFLSQGIPMIKSGDEYGHTAYGNNNHWCLDTKINHFLWDRLAERKEFFSFLCQIITLRTTHAELFNINFLSEETITWLNSQGLPREWTPDHYLAFELKHPNYSLFIAFYSGNERIEIALPKLRQEHLAYEKIVDSTTGFFSQILSPKLSLEPYSSLVAISRKKKPIEPK